MYYIFRLIPISIQSSDYPNSAQFIYEIGQESDPKNNKCDGTA